MVIRCVRTHWACVPLVGASSSSDLDWCLSLSNHHSFLKILNLIISGSLSHVLFVGTTLTRSVFVSSSEARSCYMDMFMVALLFGWISWFKGSIGCSGLRLKGSVGNPLCVGKLRPSRSCRWFPRLDVSLQVCTSTTTNLILVLSSQPLLVNQLLRFYHKLVLGGSQSINQALGG